MKINFFNKILFFITLLSLIIFQTVFSVKPKPITYELTFCENEIAIISCDENTIILFQLANYGRFSLNICNPTADVSLDTNCYNNDTLKILKKKCEGKNECDISVNNQIFGNHCPETSKYLEVKYICVSPPSETAEKNATNLCNCKIEENYQEKEECPKFQNDDFIFFIICILISCFGSAILGALFLYIFLKNYYKLIKKSELIQKHQNKDHQNQELILLKNASNFDAKTKENDVNDYDEIL